MLVTTTPHSFSSVRARLLVLREIRALMTALFCRVVQNCEKRKELHNKRKTRESE